MNIVKKALAITVIALTSLPSLATIVGGVMWDPDYGLDFEGVSSAAYQQLDLGTGELSGYGRVASINGDGGFCSGCELTYQFDSYYLADSEETPFIGDDYFTGGIVRFYVDYTIDAPLFNKILLTETNTGSEGGINALWLQLAGHVLDGGVEGITFIGHNDGTSSATGSGALDVTGGLAMGHIVPDTKMNVFDLDDEVDPAPVVSFSDFTFASSFSVFSVDDTGGTDGMPLGSSVGGATFAAKSIPEPSTIAIFALGLIALAMGAHNKRV